MTLSRNAAGAMVRVMVVEDHDLMRDTLTDVLGAEPDIDVVAACASGDEAIDVVAAAAPDVIIMDLVMPGLDGADVTAAILTRRPGPRIWLLTATPHHPRAASAVNAGAAGVLAKDGDIGAVLAAIRSPAWP